MREPIKGSFLLWGHQLKICFFSLSLKMLRLALRNNTDLLTKINTGIRLFSSTSINRGLERYFDQGKWGWRETDYSGRAWQASELRLKSFDDLHSIWWACCLEQNKLYSQWHDANRFRFDFPHRTRLEQVILINIDQVNHGANQASALGAPYCLAAGASRVQEKSRHDWRANRPGGQIASKNTQNSSQRKQIFQAQTQYLVDSSVRKLQ